MRPFKILFQIDTWAGNLPTSYIPVGQKLTLQKDQSTNWCSRIAQVGAKVGDAATLKDRARGLGCA
jgi:hypothetical protein